MQDPLLDQIRYLELRLAACQGRPALHQHQIAAYRDHLDIARASRSIADYHEAVVRRGPYALARAEWMDRYAALRRLYGALGDTDRLRAATINYEAGASSAGATDFTAHIVAGKRRAAPLRIAAETCESTVGSLVASLLDRAGEHDDDLAQQRRATVLSLWAMMRASDPACTWQRACDHPPYRSRVPFADPGMRVLGSWLRDAVGDVQCDEPMAQPAPIGPVGDAMPDDAGANTDPQPAGVANADPRPAAQADPQPTGAAPSVAEVARAYHLVHDALDPGDPLVASTRQVCEQIFTLEARATSAPQFACLMAERDLFCRLARAPLIARAQHALERAENLAQAHAQAHHRRVIERLGQCSTPTEIEYEIERHTLYLATETTWHDTVLRFALAPVIAALTCDLHPDDARKQAAITTRDIAVQVFGAAPLEVLDTPPIARFLDRMLALCCGDAEPDAPPISGGALAGEAGMWLRPVLGDVLRRRADRGRPALTTWAALRNHVQAIAAALPAKTPGEPTRSAGAPMLRMWGTPVHVRDLAAIIQAPPRPATDLT